LNTPGDRIRQRREECGLQQSALAQLSGFHPQSIGSWERNQKKASPRVLHVLAGILRVSYEWLQTGEGENPSQAPHISSQAKAVLREEQISLLKKAQALEVIPSTIPPDFSNRSTSTPLRGHTSESNEIQWDLIIQSVDQARGFIDTWEAFASMYDKKSPILLQSKMPKLVERLYDRLRKNTLPLTKIEIGDIVMSILVEVPDGEEA
jgi:transcriptional regulator with XRE-family HTH domain